MRLLATVAVIAAPHLPLVRAVSAPGEDFCVECCSLYCGAFPTVAVSKHLVPQAGNEYGSSVLEDGKGDTAWVSRSGVGEWFEFTFEASGLHPDFPAENDTTGVDRLFIWNGYNKSVERWQEHGRIRRLRLEVDGRAIALLDLLDQPQPQRIDLPPTLIRRGIRFRFVILSIYPGTRFDETAVSEARLDGYGHH